MTVAVRSAKRISLLLDVWQDESPTMSPEKLKMERDRIITEIINDEIKRDEKPKKG